ncbi:MAG: GNAT family N-acetyltransferase [Bdellovibrionales bacterium]|nr:GNAT family N-acetyltransferase [Bdellovibrionales bacterium]
MQQYSISDPLKDDYDFLKSVHHETLREHIEKIWSWNEAAQDDFFKKEFEFGQIKLIRAFNHAVGYLHVREQKHVVTIVNLLILPEFQRRGLGSQILLDILKNAKAGQRLVKLGVLKVNLDAKKLYETLGFKMYEETKTHFLMSR